jgi:D-xylose transport system ATP-binding protein
MDNYIIEMRSITKEFPGVRALDNVTLNVKKGEIHALVGENGAGKSTLMKVLSGVYSYGTYNGDILLNGKIQRFNNVKDSEKAGIATIYQELDLIKQMSIAENIFLGDEIASHGIINWDKVYQETGKLLQEVGLTVNPATKVIHLGVGEQQLVEIAKALSKNTELLILDEPTASLTESETKRLFDILRKLKAKGVTCVYISHRLAEVFEITDRVTVLRDGKLVSTEDRAKLDENKLISLMVGRELTQRFPRKSHTAGDVVLEVKDWTVYDPESEEKVCDNISFQVKKGEILGIAGLMGAGRTELVMSIFGVWGRVVSGELVLEGKKVKIRNANDAINAGLSLLSEDRKRYGLVLMMDLKDNVTLASLEAMSNLGVINQNEVIKASNHYVSELRIKTPSIEQKAQNLSGGNQQKVIIGKWLMTKPRILIMDEPTRGIDVGAKVEIYNIINSLIDEGVCIIMISSELPEIIGMSDRIVVIHEGKINGEFNYTEATQEKIMYCATGGK